MEHKQNFNRVAALAHLAAIGNQGLKLALVAAGGKWANSLVGDHKQIAKDVEKLAADVKKDERSKKLPPQNPRPAERKKESKKKKVLKTDFNSNLPSASGAVVFTKQPVFSTCQFQGMRGIRLKGSCCLAEAVVGPQVGTTATSYGLCATGGTTTMSYAFLEPFGLIPSGASTRLGPITAFTVFSQAFERYRVRSLRIVYRPCGVSTTNLNNFVMAFAPDPMNGQIGANIAGRLLSVDGSATFPPWENVSIRPAIDSSRCYYSLDGNGPSFGFQADTRNSFCGALGLWNMGFGALTQLGMIYADWDVEFYNLQPEAMTISVALRNLNDLDRSQKRLLYDALVKSEQDSDSFGDDTDDTTDTLEFGPPPSQSLANP